MSRPDEQQLEQIRAELANGQKINAVKLYKDATKCSLAEAKRAVEALESGETDAQAGGPEMQSGHPEDDGVQWQSIDDAIAEGNSLLAIKLYREMTGASLLESKQVIESRGKRQTIGPPSTAVNAQRSGCFSSAVLLIAIACSTAALGIKFACGKPPQPANESTSVSHRQAHAHNDYLHDRPLLDALDNGFCSVEADIYLIDGRLLVAHDRDKTSKERTLRKLYLDPLRQRVQLRDGSVHGDGETFTLLIDIKSDATTTFTALHQVLAEYKDLFASVESGKHHSGPVVAIISGNRAFDLIASQNPRYAGVDGRLSDLDSDQPANLMPLISDHWGRHFSWRGEGKMSPEENRKLASIISKTHAAGRRIRFWATPDIPAVWSKLAEAGVDLINTDNLTGLKSFLEQ